MSKIILFNLLFFLVFLAQGQQTDSIKMTKKSIELLPIVISNISDFRQKEKSPIVSSTISKKKIELSGENLDLPELLNMTPSVYATKQGGGYGDSKINIRGFNQRNIAVLINGIPLNDMETGWVYWSNWMNLKDIASKIQVQRGLGASKLAIPSVGGSINIYTKASEKNKQTSLNFVYSNEGFFKESIGYDSGLLDNDLALSFSLSHYKGTGFVDMTQGESYNYFANLDYHLNNKNTFMFTFFGSMQWHNQHNNASKISDYLKYGNRNINIKYNSEWGWLKDKKYTWSRNYFHKPVASLHWNYEINNRMDLTTAIYGTWGRGGGTGPIGSINYNYPNSDIFIGKTGQVRFDDIYAWNSGRNIADFGATRNPNGQGLFINDIQTGLTRYAFINNHSWYGGIINLKGILSQKISWNTGIDLRATRGNNTLTVNDILGADAYFDNNDINHPNRIISSKDFVKAEPDWNPFQSISALDKIVFYYSSNVRWQGTYAQLFYKTRKISSFIQVALSNQSYQRIDYFNLPKTKQKSKWVSLMGGNFKAGILYRMKSNHNIFFNFGYISKQPLFNSVFINPNNNQVNNYLQNEKIYAFETGYHFHIKKVEFDINTYNTLWKNRLEIVNDLIQNQKVSGKMYGVTENHFGVEAEGRLKINPIKISAMLSIGDWRYTRDINNVKLYNFQQQLVTESNYYLKDVKVGNSPQFTASFTVNYEPIKSLNIQLSQWFVDRLYADIDLQNFSKLNHKGSLELPAYSLINLTFQYDFKVQKIGKIKMGFKVNNLLNKTYISESKTNIFPNNSSVLWNGVNIKNRVFFGWGRTLSFNIELNI